MRPGWLRLRWSAISSPSTSRTSRSVPPGSMSSALGASIASTAGGVVMATGMAFARHPENYHTGRKIRPAMNPVFQNVYDDDARAKAYGGLEFPGTYWLAFRDLPATIGDHVRGTEGLDFGCGTGRSTRFLRDLGFRVRGIDISEPMLQEARVRDPRGDYRLVPDDAPPDLEEAAFDLVLAAFTFDNIPTLEKKVALFRSLRRALRPSGRLITI